MQGAQRHCHGAAVPWRVAMCWAKCNGISKAIRILEEGLNTALDREDGGELAENLGALYDYCMRRLILANARNDDAMMQEVQRLIEPMAQGWKRHEIRQPAASTDGDRFRASLCCWRPEPCPTC